MFRGSWLSADQIGSFIVTADMEDAGLVVTVAIEMLRRHGENAPPYLRDQAEIAVGLGDQPSARAWEDIAEATEAVLRRSVAIYFGRTK